MFTLVTQTFVFVIYLKMGIGTSTNFTLKFLSINRIVLVALQLIMKLMTKSFGVVSPMIYT